MGGDYDYRLAQLVAIILKRIQNLLSRERSQAGTRVTYILKLTEIGDVASLEASYQLYVLSILMTILSLRKSTSVTTFSFSILTSSV